MKVVRLSPWLNSLSGSSSELMLAWYKQGFRDISFFGRREPNVQKEASAEVTLNIHIH